MIDPQRQEAVQSAQLVVVKIGSRVLTTEEGLLDIERVENIGQQCHELLAGGKKSSCCELWSGRSWNGPPWAEHPPMCAP